jgi:predicted transcriptional regulator
MVKERQNVTEAELAVLQVLWERKSATTRELADELYPSGAVSEYYTVQKLLERLEEKECVARDRTNRVHVFRPAVGREELVGQQLKALSESLCEGSLTPLMTGLFRLRRLTADELDTLKQLVADLENTPRRKKS